MDSQWVVALDEGEAIDRVVELDGDKPLMVGEILPDAKYGRRWQIAHVSQAVPFARAVPVDDD
jgi:hypothetical protein